MNFRKIAKLSAVIAYNKKAEDILIIDVRKLTTLADYFVILSGASDVQVKAVADAIIEELKGLGIKPVHIEGKTNARWILVDYGGIIIHIFYEPLRRFYNLERLWREAKKVSVKFDAPKKKISSRKPKIKSVKGKKSVKK